MTRKKDGLLALPSDMLNRSKSIIPLYSMDALRTDVTSLTGTPLTDSITSPAHPFQKTETSPDIKHFLNAALGSENNASPIIPTRRPNPMTNFMPDRQNTAAA